MALGERLRITASDINAVQTVIKVYLEGYTGAVAERDPQPDYLNIAWGDSSGNELPFLYGATATINFWCEANFEFADLYTANSRDVYIEITKNSVTLFKGYIEAENWAEPYTAPPFEVSITAFDGLGLLADEPFVDAEGDAYTGELTPIEILAIILQKTGLQLAFNTAVNLRETTQATGVDPLTQYKVDVALYDGMTCREVLEQLFLYCRIFQRNGAWWVISHDNWTKSSISYYKYTYAGVANGSSSFTPGTAQSWWFEGQDGQVSLLPALKNRVITQEFGIRDNYVKNGDFSYLSDDGLDAWTDVGIDVTIQRSEGGSYIYILGRDLVDPWDSGSHTKYLKSDPIRVEETGYIPKFLAKCGLVGTGTRSFSATLFFGIRLIGDSSTEYWLQAALEIINESEDEYRITYKWVETSNKLGVPVKCRVDGYKEDHGILSWLYEWVYRVLPEPLPAHRAGNVLINMHEVEVAILERIPETGYIEIYLYPPNLGEPGVGQTSIITGAAWADVLFVFANDDEFVHYEIPVNQKLEFYNSGKNNFSPSDFEFVNGDVPDINNNMTIYLGDFILLDGTATNGWGVDGLSGGPYPYAEAVGRLLSSSTRQVREAYNCTFADLIPGTDMILVDTQNSSKKFLEAGITYNDADQKVQGRYVEVISDDLTGFTVKTTEDYDDSSGGGGSGSSGGSGNRSSTTIQAANTDEKVGFINKSYTVCNQPGYLHNEYFQGTIEPADEITGEPGSGRVAIKPLVLLIDQCFETLRHLPFAQGNNSIAAGIGTLANTFREIALGSFNQESSGNAEAWDVIDPLVLIGNGADANNRSDAYILYKSGLLKLFNAIVLGNYSHGAEDPVAGTLRYYNSALWLYTTLWKKIAFDSDIPVVSSYVKSGNEVLAAGTHNIAFSVAFASDYTVVAEGRTNNENVIVRVTDTSHMGYFTIKVYAECRVHWIATINMS